MHSPSHSRIHLYLFSLWRHIFIGIVMFPRFHIMLKVRHFKDGDIYDYAILK